MTEKVWHCEICRKPVPDYVPEFCCSPTTESPCGCLGQPIDPCVCSDRCCDALMRGIGKEMDQRRIDAGIELWKSEGQDVHRDQSDDLGAPGV